MTTLQKTTTTRKPRHDIALWAGVAAFFGSMLTISLLDILNPDRLVQYLSALIVALITAGAVYSKERLSAAKAEASKYSKS